MKTVFPKLRILLYVSVISSAILLLLIFQLFSSTTDKSLNQNSKVIIRDAVIRAKLENIEPIDAKKQPPLQAEHNVDFVDEKIDKKISDEIVDDAKEADIVEEKKEAVGNKGGEDMKEIKSDKEKDGGEITVSDAPDSGRQVIQAPTDVDAEKREKIKEMMKFAWQGYKNYSWGANELKPIAKMPHSQQIFGGSGMAATIIDAADTLYIMGMKDEYEQARTYIRDEFSIKKATGQLSVFETTIRFVGGLLTLFGLTGEEFYKTKAQEIANALLPAFETPSGIAKSLVNPVTNTSTNYNWAQSGSSILAEFGSLHLEFEYLSHITGNPIYSEKVKKIRNVLDKAEKPQGLYSNYMSPTTGQFTGSHISLGALGDSFYEYLIKSYLLTNKTDSQAIRMHKEASDAIQKHMVFTSKGGLRYLAELRSINSPEHKMGHLACFAPGMFGLEAIHETDPERKAKVLQLAEDLANTCHESYIRSESKIGPEMFYFNDRVEAKTLSGDGGYILRPEVLEGFFYLWRLTGNQKYKDWVWDGISAMDKHCRVGAGFAGLKNVYKPDEGHDDVQQSFFLAETLKYAYLTFDNTAIPLDKYVFNTEAHPFPIWNPNSSTK
uniref:Alpha-1,2-Mannosidase n=1 Tax=Panagrolaimus sp. PS1159 TaxID=55785 RepID=A0AC35G9H0_9BILA